jgi:hypothetical protein
MRPALLLPFFVLLVPVPARADIGPPPECPAGTHRQYLRGNNCVTDGFHLEEKGAGRS